jgi:carboxylate-amine ligase
VPYADLLEEILVLIHEDALALDCLEEVERAREILHRKTSAHQQIATYERALSEGASKQEALESVVDFLIEESVAGL